MENCIGNERIESVNQLGIFNYPISREKLIIYPEKFKIPKKGSQMYFFILFGGDL